MKRLTRYELEDLIKNDFELTNGWNRNDLINKLDRIKDYKNQLEILKIYQDELNEFIDYTDYRIGG